MGLNAKLTFVDNDVPELEGDDASIIRLELWQAISELFTLTIRVRCRASQIDMREVVGRVAEVALFKDEGQSSPQTFLPRIRGLVRRGIQLSVEETGKSTYELVIVPSLWLTSLRSTSKIFAEMTAPDMATHIVNLFHKAGITSVPQPVPPPAPTRKREYTVQYNETDLHFMRRVLAEDGISFLFAGEALEEFRLSHDTREVASDVRAQLPVLAAAAALHGGEDAVLEIESGPALRPGSQSLRDYFFDNPFFHPTASHQDDGAFELVSIIGHHDYQEEVLHEHRDGKSSLMSDADMNKQAQIRLEGRRRDHQTLVAKLTCPLPAGATLTITGDHPAAHKPQLVVRSVSVLEFSDAADTVHVVRSHRVECIPHDYPYRPPLVPKPRIHGLQRASVAGTEEIDVDEHGRVMVLFQWDNHFSDWTGPPATLSDPPSRRIGVAQDWAGPNRGLLTLPRLGDEVVVAYVDGDPDEPIIVGRLYNGRNQAAVNLPRDRTQSVWRSRSSPDGDGFHEIRFEDKKGAEELHIEAERLNTRLVKGDEQINVGGGRSITVGGSQTVEIGVDLDIHAKGNITEKADGDHTISASRTTVSSNTRSEYTIGQHGIDAAKVTIRAAFIELVAGSSSIQITPGKITITANIVDINP